VRFNVGVHLLLKCPQSPRLLRSSIPSSATSVQSLIIPSLFHEFFKGRAARACFLQFQLQPQRRENMVILEYPSSPIRPFSRASSVESPTLAFFASVGFVRPSDLRLMAICSPSKYRGNMHLIYKASAAK